MLIIIITFELVCRLWVVKKTSLTFCQTWSKHSSLLYFFGLKGCISCPILDYRLLYCRLYWVTFHWVRLRYVQTYGRVAAPMVSEVESSISPQRLVHWAVVTGVQITANNIRSQPLFCTSAEIRTQWLFTLVELCPFRESRAASDRQLQTLVESHSQLFLLFCKIIQFPSGIYTAQSRIFWMDFNSII